MTSVSIIIPVYNTEGYLKKCLNSLICQTFDDFEIIIINDGSTDNSLKILEDYANKYPKKIKLINSINQGAGKARNLGIEASTGEYIWFVDSDDWLHKDALVKMHKAAIDYNVSMVTCEFQRRIGTIKKINVAKGDSYLLDLEQYPDKLETTKPCIGNKLIKRSLIGDIRMPGLKWEDLSFTYVLAADSKKIYHLSDREYNYRMGTNNTTTKDMIKQTPRIVEIFDVLSILEQHFKDRDLYEQYALQLKDIYVFYILRRVADVTTWLNLTTENKKLLINLLIKMIKLKYQDIDINKFIEHKMPFNGVSSYFLKRYASTMIDKNIEICENETKIRNDIVKILK